MTGKLPPIVADIIAEYGVETEGTRSFSDLCERIRTLPVPVNRQVGEPLQVYSRRRHYDSDRLVWSFTIIGEHTGTDYGKITQTLSGGGRVRDVGLEGLGVGLRMALHHPEDLEDSVFEAFAELTGWKGFRCDHCEQRFISWKRAVAHEADEHGVEQPA